VLPAQIVVSSCIPALVDLLVRSLGVPECEAWVETPGFPGWWRALRNCNVRMHPIPVDESGIDVSVAIRTAPLATLAVVAPNNQFPTGVAMSNARRLELLAWAANQNSWIVEDDFDWQLAGPGAPTPLALLDGTRVVYCDTFNHILFPSLRIAYAVIPLPLLDKVITARRGIDGSMNLSVQMTLADFIAGGHLDNHLARIDEFRAGSAAALEALLEHDLSELVTPLKATGGHYICKPRLPLARLLTASRRSSTIVENMDDFRLTAEGADQVLLGHFGFATAALAKAATSLRGAVLSSLRNP
jgi:GntR family transcriptional regulator/MocR family aminotransferase